MNNGNTYNEADWEYLDAVIQEEELWKLVPCPICKSKGQLRRHSATGYRCPKFRCSGCDKYSQGATMLASMLSERDRIEKEIGKTRIVTESQ